MFKEVLGVIALIALVVALSTGGCTVVINDKPYSFKFTTYAGDHAQTK